MSQEQWISESKQILQKLAEKPTQKRDRLNLVQSMLLSLQAMHRSLAGWMQWVGNPNVMVKFSAEELREMDAKLREQTKAFIEYDIKASEKSSEILPKVRERARTRLEI